MQVRQMFGIVVRSLGLVLFYYSFVNAVYAVAALGTTPLSPRYPFGDALTWAALQFALAIVVFWGADVIVRLGYGRTPGNPAVRSN